MSIAHLRSPAPSRRTERALVVLALLLAAALWLHGPIAQWPDYHDFADRRVWLGIANAADVLSNLAFALVGAWGLVRLARAPHDGAAGAAWRLFCASLIATAAGSAFYHWAPDNTALVADRLPIAWACATLLCAFLAERVNGRWAGLPVLLVALVIASVSVVFWWLGERSGTGDLRAYLFVQFLPMLVVPAALVLRLQVSPGATPASAWWTVLALYAAAKGLELADRAVFDAIGVVSGHTLKHLLAAAGAGVIVRAAISRPAPGRSQAAG
jgi:predicted membrane channel-forming protein YqfA (hemolysin III family)